MEDPFQSPGSTENSRLSRDLNSKKVSQNILVASGPKSLPNPYLKRTASPSNGKMRRDAAGHAALFLLKVGALETVRRFSKAKCPFVWSGLQALQAFCYPPLKWLQRWDLFKTLVTGLQTLSNPLLVISVASAFSNQSGCTNVTSAGTGDSHSLSDIHAVSESDSEVPSGQCTPGARISDETLSSQSSKYWLLQLYMELENQGIKLPERINEDELQRFHTAASGDFPYFFSSVKKTIRWRETYRILSEQELEMWSDMVFWHGFDVKNRPCLFIRLGRACINFPPSDRPRFAQAIVSQVEHGILNLVDNENPQITVLVDCEGLSLRFPMQLMRSCSSVLQDNFPNRLGCLYVIRLPPVVRVIAQTFIQVLKPVTRQKLKIEGPMFRKVLSEYLQTLPAYLGGACTCSRCANLGICNTLPLPLPRLSDMMAQKVRSVPINSSEDLPSLHPNTETNLSGSCDQALRAAVVGVLILWALIAFAAGIYDPESRPTLPI